MFTEPTTPAMGRKALLILAFCLAFSDALGKSGKTKVISIGDASVSRLYRNVPVGVYASASPYAAYSFHAPTAITAPRDMRVIPVKEEVVFVQNTDGFLKDSYGNKFVDSPQMVGFKTTFPQQFVRLQDLPLHLSQPLGPGAPAFQFNQGAPHSFAPAQFRLQGLQAPSPSPFARYAVSHPILQNTNIKNFAAPTVLHRNFKQPHFVPQQQSTSNKAIFVNTQSHEQYNKLKSEPKFQRLQESPRESPRNIPVAHENKNKNFNHPQGFHVEKEQLQESPAKVTTHVNGENTVVTLQTKPTLPLLDISLLEPLTFDNPLVPQVQHFLPRISEATYHKLPIYNVDVNNENQHETVQQKPRPYERDSAKGKPKSKNNTHKKKQKSPEQNETDFPVPTITVKGTPNVSPEFSYEINSPNYKETYKEQVVSYNKETNTEPVTYSYNKETQSEPVHYSYNKETKSEPVHYTYEKQIQSKPVHYSYEHNSKQPQQEKQIYYENEGHGPKHLVYTIKTGQNNDKQINHVHGAPAVASKERDSSEHDDAPQQRPHKNHNIEHEQYADAPQSPRHLVPEHREVAHQQKNTEDDSSNHEFPKSLMDLINAQVNSGHFQGLSPERNRGQNLLQSQKPNEPIRVDPNQHIQQSQAGRPNSDQNNNYVPNQHIYEKSKHVIIKDETPDGVHLHNEKQNTETVDEEENNEENFEKAYKNAAFGFPGFESNPEDIEKDIYNPESYGVARNQNDFDIEHAPFQQYYEEGDKFPKETHSSYKDSRDKVKENYFLDFSINKPESLIDKYNNKLQYYKMYKKQRPENYFGSNRNEDKESEQKNAKYSAAPTYLFSYERKEKPKQQFARYQISPQKLYEYDYAKEAPRDNAAYSSQPYQKFKTKTQFVEPQFQYGFEPSSVPHLLDSELASMASNVSPESEKPGTRKKLYEENWYIKKTTTSGGNS